MDYGHLADTAQAAKELLGVEKIDVVADRGYFQAEDIEACEQAGITPFVPKPDRGPVKSDGFFPKESFIYDAERDDYHCSGDKFFKLRGVGTIRGMERRMYTGHSVYPGCALKDRCTKSRQRQVTRYENEALLERMATRLAALPEMQDIRRQTVEHPCGAIKQSMNQGAFLMRRLENMSGKFNLTTLAYNLRRALNIVGVEGLILALKAAKYASIGPVYRSLPVNIALSDCRVRPYGPMRADIQVRDHSDICSRKHAFSSGNHTVCIFFATGKTSPKSSMKRKKPRSLQGVQLIDRSFRDPIPKPKKEHKQSK